jgi:hypothetical protein
MLLPGAAYHMNTCILCSRRIIILGGSGHAVLWKAMAVSEEAKKMTSIENEEEFRHNIHR